MFATLPRVTTNAFVAGVAIAFATFVMAGCKRSEPPPDLLKSQREQMERAKEVGKTMQKSVDDEGRKADEEGK